VAAWLPSNDMRALPPPRTSGASIPASAGIGLRFAHLPHFLSGQPRVAWLEVHSENYFAAGGKAHAALASVRSRYPLSFHGVGLSLGSSDPLERRHLRRLAELVKRYEPGLVSEHLSWSSVGGRFANDLLPLPATREVLEHLVLRVDEAQEYLGVRLLLENVTSYLALGPSEMPESCFWSELVQRTGCGVLLDVNNLYVNQCNHGGQAAAFIAGLPADCVGEIHVAGHTVHEYDGERVVVDTHDRHVSEPVWALYELAIARFGAVPTLVEWDSSLPTLPALLDEAHRAQRIMEAAYALAA
jgi:uncharacterized protein (UPF0276 family)